MVGDPAPSGDSGSSHPEPPLASTAVLCSLLGTEIACFRVFPEDAVVEAASPSAVTPAERHGLKKTGLQFVGLWFAP